MIQASRRAVLAGAGVSVAFGGKAMAAGPIPLAISGAPQQGGGLIVRTRPGAAVILDGATLGPASPNGLFFLGFDRDAPHETTVMIDVRGNAVQRRLQVAPGEYDVQRIDGLAPDQVTPQAEDLLARISAESLRKSAGFSSHIDADSFADGFQMPVNATRLSARFGGQRVLNGVPARPHYGTDLAAPVGTPVISPAPGVVAFAETGLHYEGGLIFIDHGQGLISAYLHLSRVDVAVGQVLNPGQLIGTVGMEGRATGPHLCWRLKWRGRNLDPMLMVGLRAPPMI